MAGIFGFFDYTKPGKGVNKEDVNKKGISLYFDILLRRFRKLIPLNLMYIIAYMRKRSCSCGTYICAPKVC